jgi:hypothetical protein
MSRYELVESFTEARIPLQRSNGVQVWDTQYPAELGGPRRLVATFTDRVDAHNYTAFMYANDAKFNASLKAVITNETQGE